MKRSLRQAAGLFVTFVLLCSFGCSGAASRDRSPTEFVTSASYDGGKIYRTYHNGETGSFDIVVLSGDWKQMGRQYGYLYRSQFKELQDAVMTYLVSKGVTQQQLAATAEEMYQAHLDYAKELVQGMAETSGLGLEQQKIVNALIFMAIMTPGCSSMNAWGDYTGGGPLVAGRNWDIAPWVNQFNRFMQVVIYKPTGAIPAADISYLGLFLFQSGMNKHGVFLDLQNGNMSDATERPDRPDVNDVAFSFLMESASVEQLDAKFLANPTSMGWVMNAVDAHKGRVYEWASFGTQARSGNGLLASTNHFISPDWTVPLPVIGDGAAGSYTKERLANLLNLGETMKGSIDAKAMMAIFDKTIDQGGPSFPGGKTVHQIVAVPAELTIWLKATGYSGWEKIMLGPLF